MTDSPAAAGCIACGAGSDAVPLLSFEYRGVVHRICPQHLPWLVHDPGRLAALLPGADDFPRGTPPS